MWLGVSCEVVFERANWGSAVTWLARMPEESELLLSESQAEDCLYVLMSWKPRHQNEAEMPFGICPGSLFHLTGHPGPTLV